MKRLLIFGLVFAVIGGTAWALESVDGTKLTGGHFTLNIIGAQNPKTADMDSDTGNGSTIFVDIDGKSKIGLVESGSDDAPMVAPDEFAVLDKNGTDQNGALLALPNPGLDPYIVGDDMTGVDTLADYSIYVRPLGKPFGQATITTCADFVESGLEAFLSAQDIKVLNAAAELGGVASIEQVGTDITYRDKGKTTFTNVTAELTTIVLAVEIYVDDGFGGLVYDSTVYVRVPIFDPLIENEYWEYDNEGLKHLQVRIYPWETDVSAGDSDLPVLPQVPQP